MGCEPGERLTRWRQRTVLAPGWLRCRDASRRGRRAVLYLHTGPGLPLVIVAVAACLTAVAAEASRAIRGYLDEK